MKNAHQRKRIGLVLASLHTGSSLKLWSQLALDAAQSTDPFFIFPGGRLVNRFKTDNLRNAIYDLVNTDNLDGLISWSSSIGGGVPFEELRKFHSDFSPLPYVTIGQKITTQNGDKIEEHPCVDFDAYYGMKSLIKHFIDVHKAKKIAFLHGPANHQSALDRYRAYVDVVRAAGYSDSEIRELVSSPCSWNDGEKAIRELVELRKLNPGKDFDVLIASSDMMALAAVNWLKTQGIKVPRDVLVGGFNDSVESNITSSPFSTVHMPYEELGIIANRMIHELLDGNKDVSDSTLETELLIRESCGCNSAKTWSHTLESQNQVNTTSQLADELASVFGLSSQDRKMLVLPLVHDFENGDSVSFFTRFGNLVFNYLKAGHDVNSLFKITDIIYKTSYINDEYINRVLPYIDRIIAKMQSRNFALHRYETTRIYSALNTLKCDLLTVHDKNALIKLLAQDLPLIGIHSMSIVLYENDNYSRYIGGFSAGKVFEGMKDLFPSGRLVPIEHEDDYACGVFVVQPLFMENQPLGYFITSYTNCEGTIYEDLRSVISNAIKSILQFEETTNAKSIAEQAEYAKTEFFANVGSDLCDPLNTISEKIDQIEKNIEKGVLDKDILSDQLLFLKAQVMTQLEKTETLVDLTRSQIDDLPMDKKLFDIREALPRNKGIDNSIYKEEYPLLYGDSDRLSKALLILSEESKGGLTIKATAQGMHIYIKTGRVNWYLPALQLAEKIIMLQFGEIIKNEDSAVVIFPWPNLACLTPIKNNSAPTEILSFSESENMEKELLGLPVHTIDDNFSSASHENILLLWRSDNAPVEEWLKIYSLRHDSKLFRTPILCYSSSFIGHDFMEALEQKVRTQKTDPILFVSCKHTRYSPWATDRNSISIPSIESFDKILQEIVPSIIVFEKVDREGIRIIRQNQKTVLVPILVLPDTILSEEDVSYLCENPRIILCNRGAAESEQFGERVMSILSGDEILPPHTGALVKNAILYLNKNASAQIVRWKLADVVHVSEDYLTRIFHKEIGLSLWEYLNRYRIYLATKMLLETNDTIYEIAENSGFQDQAYFCRVFKKIYGVPPGKIRTNNRNNK